MQGVLGRVHADFAHELAAGTFGRAFSMLQDYAVNQWHLSLTATGSGDRFPQAQGAPISRFGASNPRPTHRMP